MRCDHPPAVSTTAAGDPLAHLAPDQRAAAAAPPGPVLCVAPAGSGKTTTLVARIAWLVAGGADPGSIRAITFNRRAAAELAERLERALDGLAAPPGSVRVQTFHALAREILVDAGHAVEPLLDRDALLREIQPELDPARRRALDDAFSRLKLDLGVTAPQVATDPDPGPVARTFLHYEAALEARGGLDFDDLVVRALRALEADAALLGEWRGRCRILMVDEVQDVDRMQLRLALLLAAPGNDIFLVGDDDQTIYGWRLADVRRVLGLAAELPGLRRMDLVTNYRCPRPVVERAVQLVGHNRERFAKTIRARPNAGGGLVLAPDAADDVVRIRRVLERWPTDGSTRAILARTNHELVPASAAAVQGGWPFRAPALALPAESPVVDVVLQALESRPGDRRPLLVRLGEVIGGLDARGSVAGSRAAAPDGAAANAFAIGPSLDDPVAEDRPAGDLVTVRSLLAWAPAFATVGDLRDAVMAHRAALARLRSDRAALTMATVHGTKGLEWDHVAVIGLESGRFPSARSVTEAEDPERALEEERRLAYVAWTRARRSLTLLYDPGAPSQFLLEAFTPEELGLPAA